MHVCGAHTSGSTRNVAATHGSGRPLRGRSANARRAHVACGVSWPEGQQSVHWGVLRTGCAGQAGGDRRPLRNPRATRSAAPLRSPVGPGSTVSRSPGRREKRVPQRMSCRRGPHSEGVRSGFRRSRPKVVPSGSSFPSLRGRAWPEAALFAVGDASASRSFSVCCFLSVLFPPITPLAKSFMASGAPPSSSARASAHPAPPSHLAVLLLGDPSCPGNLGATRWGGSGTRQLGSSLKNSSSRDAEVPPNRILRPMSEPTSGQPSLSVLRAEPYRPPIDLLRVILVDSQATPVL